ncbi:hypothetical protein BJ878DRAFT_417695, partial [Calycina marina]
ARSDRDLTPELITKKISEASGANYSAGSATPAKSSDPPPAASRPAFNPTRSAGTSAFNPLAGQRAKPDGKVDADGWGSDAPPVARSQLEKVQPAYKPTKVNMAELTKQKPEQPSRFNDAPTAVKGAYQPVGKVDIAAIRAQSQGKDDDRPAIVKGAYEPVGKVDIAAIRARAQKPSDDGARQLSPPAIDASATSNTSDEPKSLADRSSAFSQSERLTTLPKPKVGNKFGSGVAFTGTKAPTPGVFGLQSAPANAVPPQIGAASRTFADEGGKTPAQIWAEKKARQRGLSGAGDSHPSVTSPIASQTSGGGEWKSGYAGKSWAPVSTNATGRSGAGSIGQQRTGDQESVGEENQASPGIGALKDRFKGGGPMGAPVIPGATTGEQSHQPPPINTSSRPPPITLPSRPLPQDEEEEEHEQPNIPPPPRIQRSPTPDSPEREASPVRIAMPISRSKAADVEAPEERNSPPALPKGVTRNVPDEKDLTEEPKGHDPARAAGAAVAVATFGAGAAAVIGGNDGSSAGGKRAVAQYDYEKAEDNELELTEGEYVTNIEMVDEDWWMGTNSKAESGLFPSNYVELVEDDDEAPASQSPPPAPVTATRPAADTPGSPAGPTASTVYDYEAAEDNELSFPENAKITGLEFPDEDWWFGHFEGKSGLFPANYVQLDE